MNIKKSSYLKRFIVTCAVSIGLVIVFLAIGLNIFHSVFDFLKGLVILILLSIFMVILKTVFRWINTEEVMDGIWGGIVLYCLMPIVTLTWNINFWDALARASTYLVIGLIVLVIGYLFRRKM